MFPVKILKEIRETIIGIELPARLYTVKHHSPIEKVHTFLNVRLGLVSFN